MNHEVRSKQQNFNVQSSSRRRVPGLGVGLLCVGALSCQSVESEAKKRLERPVMREGMRSRMTDQLLADQLYAYLRESEWAVEGAAAGSKPPHRISIIHRDMEARYKALIQETSARLQIIDSLVDRASILAIARREVADPRFDEIDDLVFWTSEALFTPRGLAVQREIQEIYEFLVAQFPDLQVPDKEIEVAMGRSENVRALIRQCRAEYSSE